MGIGSTRKAYRVSSYVIKVNIHPLGFVQSSKEFEIYHSMKNRELHHFLAETLYLTEDFVIQRYYPPLPLQNNQSYDVTEDALPQFHTVAFKDLLSTLDKEFDSFDLKDSSNYGWNDEGQPVLVDYGMTKEVYERQWVPLAESGELPQIEMSECTSCGLVKELRMYGSGDADKRCYSCGKQ
ncbi:hypothetical protein N781_04845 [Pontibacillus halophilus JSM 076056 = DSM 19796]|uniref:Protein kinase n=1 Tax=Pontibacillus halophilus JSM 076056 = DSM 19796 TaxID=1385510 RepID=A0A0A5GDV0_9BACI|nr:hypothetical protein N781_04845 [Pontibacillus halophilus JSM 076056 = DSM 19796]